MSVHPGHPDKVASVGLGHAADQAFELRLPDGRLGQHQVGVRVVLAAFGQSFVAGKRILDDGDTALVVEPAEAFRASCNAGQLQRGYVAKTGPMGVTFLTSGRGDTMLEKAPGLGLLPLATWGLVWKVDASTCQST